MQILLLNPPGNKIYLRDYYCSKRSKADYIYHPVDLLIISGILAERHKIKVLDAIAERLSFEACFKQIIDMDIDAIVFLTGAVSWKTDFDFFKKIKQNKEVIFIGTGDVLLENGREWLEKHDWLDAIIFDFTSDSILYFLEKSFSKINNMVFRKNGQIIECPEIRENGIEFEIPIPRIELFPNHRYSFPLARKAPFATVLTDYGCPFNCSFCIMNTLGYKYRKMDNVMEELASLSQMGFKEIYFDDQTFGARRERAFELCNQITKKGLQFSWCCWTRVDIVDKELLNIMKQAGCHTIMFGVETASNLILARYNKDYTKEQVIKAFDLCQKLNIRTLGTYIIGLPGEDKASCIETIEFSKTLDSDFASFNVPVPRANTQLRREAIKNNWIDSDLFTMDQSGSYVVMETDYLSKGDIQRLRKKAVKNFLLRPSYIWKRLVKVRTFHEMKKLARGGWAMLSNNVSDIFN